ncbi:hypothetical protein EWM64_g7917 [Hericium alpestre]|uniref:Uncharacterized protein n=1 Tax=Hericium alpestre TaxID=135208 RepID=A0A4Y9ZPW5_9AGAM|nr:hypothetical protein EWM64_g7917 [Hericium alpestre]
MSPTTEPSQLISSKLNRPPQGPRLVKKKQPMMLAMLFNYSIEYGWDDFWSEGVKNYKDETVF